MIADLSAGYARAFPLTLGGGVFVAIAGAAMLIGALWFRRRNVILGVGAAVATLAMITTTIAMASRFGPPTLLQIMDLVVAVALEAAAFAWLVPRFWPKGERTVTLAILMIVGLHFILMTPAFGALIALLGVLATANAYVGVRFPGLELRILWCLDASLKVAAGVSMCAVTVSPGA